MKLGEALSLRARKAQQLDDLRRRLKALALVQEGQEPAEDPAELVEEFETVSDEHAGLVERIARTNAAAEATNGDNMLTLLQEREKITRKRNLHHMLAEAASPGRDAFRFMRSEITFLPAVDVREHRKTVEEMDAALRTLDTVLQESNWKIDLV